MTLGPVASDHRHPSSALDATQSDIFILVLRHGPMSRAALAEEIGVDTSTITRAMPGLLRDGWVREVPARRGSPGRGRPTQLVRVQENHHLAVGIKIGPDSISGVVTDLMSNPLERRQQNLGSRDPVAVLRAVAGLVTELADAAVRNGEPGAGVVGVGIGVGGHVDGGRVRRSHIMGWTDVDVAATVADLTGLPVVAHNDVSSLAVAHHWFSPGRSVESLGVISLGRGIGCGLILNGQLHQGGRGSAGELGHIPLDPQGPICACGNVGCLESLASDLAVLHRINSERTEPLTDIDVAAALARAGDPVAQDSFALAGDALGRGIAVINNLLNLERVVLAGEMVTAVDVMEPAMRAAIARHSFSDAGESCDLVVDCDTDDMWERGAACLSIRTTIRQPDVLVRPPRLAG